MALIDRIEDLIKSEINAFLDKAEDPQKMTAQIESELQDALAECRSTAAQIIAEQKSLSRQHEDLAKGIERWQQQAELAVSKGRDDLAKAALIEKQKLVDTQEENQKQAAQLEDALHKLNEDAARLSNKIAEVKAKQHQFYRAQNSAVARLKVRSTLNSEEVQNVCARFSQLEQKVERIEAQVESYDIGKNDVYQEFKQMEQDEKLSEELAALKQKMSGKQTVEQSTSAQ
ncbi:PspA/IM30 family protein [Pseudoalteromonas phenolica]|uniref:PspA/IM30 family protein n=1 Tax=Pseudoalteromonas phenolica TaxID=161398 RepID=UPI00110A10E1|nr:PspA/IM30 family protein [Pseudoalteromonas phenolica]TMO53099.1 phage shock protein A [Pseudoalteromonas phenolica]